MVLLRNKNQRPEIKSRRDNVLVEKRAFFEMANLKRQESGLPYDIWLDSAGYRRNIQHSMLRIEVGIGEELVPVVIASQTNIRPLKPFKKSNEVIAWVSRNYDTLFRHWNGDLSDRQALNLLAKD